MITVFVVMLNDYPDGVFSTKARAEQYVKEQKEAWHKNHKGVAYSLPNFRIYPYELDKPDNYLSNL